METFDVDVYQDEMSDEPYYSLSCPVCKKAVLDRDPEPEPSKCPHLLFSYYDSYDFPAGFSHVAPSLEQIAKDLGSPSDDDDDDDDFWDDEDDLQRFLEAIKDKHPDLYKRIHVYELSTPVYGCTGVTMGARVLSVGFEV